MNRIKYLDVILFTRHLAVMLRSGIPVAESLSTLSEQTRSKAFKKVIDSILSDLQNGQPLARSLAKHPKVFDQFYVNLIDISEQSGSLDENLEFIAKQLAKTYSLKKKAQSAMLYPGIILIAAVGIGGFISFFALPKLVDFFQAFDIELPLTTRILLFVANAFKYHGTTIFAVFVAVSLLIRLVISFKAVKPLWHQFLLKLPVFGEFLSDTQLAQFSRNLGVLIKSGVPIAKGLNITAQALSNLKFKNDLLKVGAFLSQGTNISTAMEKEKFSEFPPLVFKMIEVGEKTGRLDEALLYLADFYEDEIDNITKNLTVVLEPILLIFIGLVVGFVALAIITPIYELTGSIRR